MNAEESVEISALSIDEAILIGLTRLAATRDEVTITILDEGSRGFLGLGTRMARVSITLRSEDMEESDMALNVTRGVSKTETQDEEPVTPQVEDKQAPKTDLSELTATPEQPALSESTGGKDKREPHITETAPAVSDDTAMLYQRVEEVVKLTADNLLGSLSVQLSTEWREDEGRPTIWISIRGADADAIVGPRAQTLNAVQYLLRTLVHRQVDGNYDLVVDAGGYRMRRLRSLENLAQQNADKAVESGRTVRLRSMPAHERRIIHILLREDERVETHSVGTGRERAVTIIPKSASDN